MKGGERKIEPLTPDSILALLTENRKRLNYIVSLLEFKLGREPTQEEIDIVNRDNELSRKAREQWIAMQPWHVRKRHVDKSVRIQKVLEKRYSAPQWLIQVLLDETSPDW